MRCPARIEPTILEIIRCALLNIRSSGWDSNAAECALEADHVHNLPTLILDYSDGAVKYYLGPCREQYIRGMQNNNTGALQRFHEFSHVLGKLVDDGNQA